MPERRIPVADLYPLPDAVELGLTEADDLPGSESERRAGEPAEPANHPNGEHPPRARRGTQDAAHRET